MKYANIYNRRSQVPLVSNAARRTRPQGLDGIIGGPNGDSALGYRIRPAAAFVTSAGVRDVAYRNGNFQLLAVGVQRGGIPAPSRALAEWGVVQDRVDVDSAQADPERLRHNLWP